MWFFSFAAFSHYLHPFVQLSFAIWSQVEGTSSLEKHFRTSSWLNLLTFPLSSPLMLLYKLKKKHASVLAFQAEVIMNYHVGETVLSLQKTTLIPGGSESLVYTTLSGGIGILVPFTSHEVSKPKHQAAVLLLFVHLSPASILNVLHALEGSTAAENLSYRRACGSSAEGKRSLLSPALVL